MDLILSLDHFSALNIQLIFQKAEFQMIVA